MTTPIQYTIQAEIIDIRQDQPRLSDRFVVDTNVWFWLTYPNASPYPHQIWYPKYVKNVQNSNAQLYRSNLSLPELAHLIEGTERKVFNETRKTTQEIEVDAKIFRHNFPIERTNVAELITNAWALVRQLAQSMDTAIDDAATNAALTRLQLQALDGYDLLIIEAMLKMGITHILTDDGDFVTTPGIQVYTANGNVIDQARSQGKLIIR